MIYSPVSLQEHLRRAYESGFVAGAEGVAEVPALGMIADFIHEVRREIGSISTNQRNALARAWKHGYKNALEEERSR